jgi:hypothetical protein
LNRVFEKVVVAYGLHPVPSTEANTEAAKKRKVDACVRSTWKRGKVVGKKKVVVAPKGAATSKAATTPRGAATTMPKIVVALKAATVIAVTLATPSTIGGAITSKASTAGQKGALWVTKADVVKIKARMKRPTNVELSLVETAKQLKAAKASLSALASTQKVAAPSPHAPRSDDDNRVELCLMLGEASTMSSSSSSSSDSLALESTQAPWPNPNAAICSAMVIARSEFPMIPEMLELETTQSDMMREEMGPQAPYRASGSASMFLS